MCLRAEGIDDNDGCFVRLIRSKGLRNNDGGVGRGQGIRDASKGSETTTDTAGGRRRSGGIYEDDGFVEGVR